MHKEMHEQPATVAQTLRGRLDRRFATAHLGGLDLSARDLLGVRRVKILGCGSAYYAGLAGALLIEGLSRLPADAETASEFRYRNPVIDPETLYVAVSQSGETFDTLAAVQEVKRKGGDVIGVVNAPGSTIAGECGSGVYIHAGPEVSVDLDQELHVDGGGVRPAGPAPRAGARPRPRRRRPADRRRSTPCPATSPPCWPARTPSRPWPATLVAPAASMFFVGRVGGYAVALEGRAEAQGGLVRPRRGLPGRRAEARPAGAGRPRGAHGGGAARRPPAGEEPVLGRGDPGPARPGRSR